MNKAKEDNLLVVWTSGDKEVALKMVFMYARNSMKKAWWDRVKLVVWGPSSNLLAQDKELQEQVKIMQDFGVEMYACITCADMYGVTDALQELGIEVIPMGVPLTEMLKGEWKTVTF